MATSNTLLAYLKAGRCSTPLRFDFSGCWESRNVRKGSKQMSVDMLFPYEKSDNKFRLSDAHVSFRFIDGTKFVELKDSDKPIPNSEVFLHFLRIHSQELTLSSANRLQSHERG